MVAKILSFLSIIDDTTGKLSYSRTMVLVGFLVVNAKLIFSGINILDKFKISDFSGVDYGASIAALSGLHIFNKQINNQNTDAPETKS